MLHSFNCLYPHFYNMVSTDEFVVSAKGMLSGHEVIIDQNEETKYLGYTIMPSIAIDIDQDNFIFQDLFSSNITTDTIQVFYDGEWTFVNFSESVAKTDLSYPGNGNKVYVKVTKHDSLIKRTIFSTKELDFFILSKTPLDKFKFFINIQNRVSITGGTDESVVSIDSTTNAIVTDVNTYTLLHSDFINTLSVNDIIPRYSMLDEIFNVYADDGSTTIMTHKDFGHLTSKIKSDININVELAV